MTFPPRADNLRAMTPKAPFQMKPSAGAKLMCDGKLVISGRASFVWETYLLRRVAGVPGHYAIRLDNRANAAWHVLNFRMREAEEALRSWSKLPGYAERRISMARKTREARGSRGLPVG